MVGAFGLTKLTHEFYRAARGLGANDASGETAERNDADRVEGTGNDIQAGSAEIIPAPPKLTLIQRAREQTEKNGTKSARTHFVGPMRGNGLKFRWLLTATMVALVVISMPSVAEQLPSTKGLDLPQGYRIGAGDVLQIVVWRETDASVPEAVVRSDGRISLPLIGDIEAAGLSPAELETSLVRRLSQFYNTPVVSVLTKAINSRWVYVSGNVKREGPVALTRPMNVLQALQEAGGLSEWARKTKIYVLRKSGGKQEKLPFNYKAVINGGHLEQNVDLLPNDTIVVP